MPDDLAPDTPDTPTTPSTDTPEIPWQKRYEDLRPEFDRTTQALKDAESVWEDEQAALARLQERFPHLFEDEDDETPTDDDEPFDDPSARELAELRKQNEQLTKWQQEVEKDRGEQRFQRDLTDVLGDRTLNDRQAAWVKDRTAALGNNRKALEQAVEEWFEVTAPPEPTPEPKRAPHVIANGQTVTSTKRWEDMTDEEALAAQVELAQQLQS